MIIGSTRGAIPRLLLEECFQSQQLCDGGLDLRVAVAEALLLLEVSDDSSLGIDLRLDFSWIYWGRLHDTARSAERAVRVADPRLCGNQNFTARSC